MKIPVIRQFVREQSVENLEKAVEVLESFSEFRGVSDEELNVAGELITNLLGAMEVHQNIANGMEERDALNGFSKKVLGSIDQ